MSTSTSSQTKQKQVYVQAAIASAAVFLLYLLTLAPSVTMWDTGEYIAATKVLGVPHQPGNPFFMVLAHAFGLIPIPVSYGVRINLLAALTSACSAGLWFLLTERIARRWIPERWHRLIVAALATLIGATAFTVWNQSVVNEKVYTVSLLFFTTVSWLMIAWMEDPDAPGADRLLLLVAFLVGLGYSNHPAGFLPIPAVGVAILATRWKTLLRWRLVAKALALVGLGLTPFLYEPIRAAHFPAINSGAPTACTTTIGVGCTFDPLTVERLKANITREQFGVKEGRQAPFVDQVGMWWLYFKWQWLRDPDQKAPGLQALIALMFLMLGLLGAYVHWLRDRETFWYFGPLMFTMTLALIYYLNFKFGWSQNPELRDVDREVRDRDYFYIWSFSAWGVWAALGLAFVWEQLAGMMPRPRRALLVASPVLLMAFIPLVSNWDSASRAGHTFTREWAHDYLNSLEPYAIVITHGDNDTFPLWYSQEVEGIRRDVTVAVSTYLGTDWFVRQMIRQPVETYDAAKGPSLYRGQEWKKPTGPPIKLSFAQADSIPDYVEIRQPQVFRQGQITVDIPPGYLLRKDLVLLRLVKDTFPERPIYISLGGDPGVDLRPYLLTQGFAQKLVDHRLQNSPATPLIGGSFLDVARTQALWNSVYRGQKALIAEGKWVDRASSTIPYTYAVVGTMLAEGLSRTGNLTDAKPIMDTVTRIARAARLEGFRSE